MSLLRKERRAELARMKQVRVMEGRKKKVRNTRDYEGHSDSDTLRLTVNS